MVPSSSSSSSTQSLFFFFFFFLFLLFTIPGKTSDIEPTKLVNDVCKQASDYTFCVNSLYSDSRTPQADQYTLAYISVGLASDYATATQQFISELLNNVSSGSGNGSEYHNLQICVEDYKNIDSLMVTANNDLNSETFFELTHYAAKVSDFADHCQAAVPSSASTARTRDLKGLCQIFGIIGNLYGGGSGSGSC